MGEGNNQHQMACALCWIRMSDGSNREKAQGFCMCSDL